jgi:tetratricopeptide (TPR) repeat protein
MKAISKLKDDARKYEHNEEWEKAVQVYLQVLDVGGNGDADVELSLYNRIGDLYIRLGRPDDAVTYYEQAADRYADAGLYNNAIALCNKAMRYRPDHPDLLRKLGQFSASQGFLIDARRYFLQYAETRFAAGAVHDALSAMEDFANVAEDPEIREMLGRQLHAHGRTEEAAAELRKAHSAFLMAGQADRAEAVMAELRAVDPAAAMELSAGPAEPLTAPAFDAESTDSDDDAGLSNLDLQSDTVADAAGAQNEPAGSTLEGFETTQLAGAEEHTPREFTGLSLPGIAEDTEDAEDADVASFGTLEGLESTALDFGAAAAELAGADLGIEVEHAGTSFDLPSLEEPFDGVGGSEPPALEEHEEAVASRFDLPSLAEREEDFADFELPSLAQAEEDFADFELPSLAGEEEDFADFELPSLDEVEEDFAAFDLPVPADEGALDAGSAFDLPMFEADEDAAQELELPGYEEKAEDASAGHSALADFAAGPADAATGPEGLADGATDSELEPPVFDDMADPISGDIPGDIPGESADDRSAPAPQPPMAELDDDPLVETGVVGLLDTTAATEQAALAGAELTQVRTPGNSAPGPLEAGRSEAGPDAAAPEHPAPHSDEGFIDLGALLADDEPEITRFQVQETTPTGDEDRDFAELLNQFKAKVSQHLPAEDAAAHYDLGLAFKEMGLIDEAISEFQVALRAGHMQLKVFEELGDCFLQKDQYNIAEKVLRRGLEMKYEDELELLGVYYHLGRAYEGLGRGDQARDAYERVLGMDINFQDVSARLSRL